MKVCRIVLAVLCVHVAPTSAIEIMDANEKGNLAEIEREFGVDEMLIATNNRLSTLMTREHGYADIAKELALKQARYAETVARLPKAILEKGNTAELYAEIESLVIYVEGLKQKAAAEKKSMAEERKTIAADYTRIETTRTTRSTRLLELKASITRRIAARLSDTSSVQRKNDKGTVKCSKFKTLNECIKDVRRDVIAASIETDPFLNENSVLLSFEMVDANVNLDGDLRYQARMSFKPSYTNEVDALLNERLGLNSAQVKLTSNVSAEWFIDGTKVGKGKEISRNVPLGRHGVLAVYRSQQQSTVENIQGSRVLKYSFRTQRSVASASVRAKARARTTRPTRRTASARKSEPEVAVAVPRRARAGKPGAAPTTLPVDACSVRKGGCPSKREPALSERDSRDRWLKSMGVKPASK